MYARQLLNWKTSTVHRKSPLPSRARYPIYIDRLVDIPVSFYYKKKIMPDVTYLQTNSRHTDEQRWVVSGTTTNRSSSSLKLFLLTSQKITIKSFTGLLIDHSGHTILNLKFQDIPELSKTFSANFKDLQHQNSRIVKDQNYFWSNF